MQNKYKYYSFHVDEEGKKIIAVTHYAGRAVRGIAKCAPEDTFDIELGCKIAVARCEIKVARAKIRNAAAKYLEAAKAADAAQKRYDNMKQYYMDAVDQLDSAIESHNKIINKIQQ
jgi:hypothetical protein